MNYSTDQITDLIRNIPKYILIKMDITNKIKSGEYPAGGKIPTEQELCDKYKCSRLTVRRALSELLHEDLIHKIQGSGTYVKQNNSAKQDLKGVNSCSMLISSQGKTPYRKILKAELEEAPDFIKLKFGLNDTDKIFSYVRVYYADDVPVIFGISYFNAKYIPNIEKIDFTTVSIIDVLKEKYSMELTCSGRELKAELSDKQLSQHLDIPENYPILIVNDLKTSTFQGISVPIEFYHFAYVTDRIKYSPEIT